MTLGVTTVPSTVLRATSIAATTFSTSFQCGNGSLLTPTAAKSSRRGEEPEHA